MITWFLKVLFYFYFFFFFCLIHHVRYFNASGNPNWTTHQWVLLTVVSQWHSKAHFDTFRAQNILILCHTPTGLGLGNKVDVFLFFYLISVSPFWLMAMGNVLFEFIFSSIFIGKHYMCHKFTKTHLFCQQKHSLKSDLLGQVDEGSITCLTSEGSFWQVSRNWI